MNIRPPFIAHSEWVDSVADWAMQHNLDNERRRDLEADYTAADRAEGVYTAPQGRAEQGWRIRPGNVAEMACYAPDDEPPREDMSPAEAVLLCAIYCISAVGVLWLLLTLSQAWS